MQEGLTKNDQELGGGILHHLQRALLLPHLLEVLVGRAHRRRRRVLHQNESDVFRDQRVETTCDTNRRLTRPKSRDYMRYQKENDALLRNKVTVCVFVLKCPLGGYSYWLQKGLYPRRSNPRFLVYSNQLYSFFNWVVRQGLSQTSTHIDGAKRTTALATEGGGGAKLCPPTNFW